MSDRTLETAREILEGRTTSSAEEMTQAQEMKAMMAAYKSHLEMKDMGEEEISERMKEMKDMSFEDMKEMMKKEKVKYEMAEAEEVEDASGKGAMDASGKGVELGTLDGAKKAKKVKDPKASGPAGKVETPKMKKEHLETLFTGEELSEDFKTKAETLFESALNLQVEQITEDLESQANAQVEEICEAYRNDLSEKMDDYLSYVVEEWMKDNELAVERGIKGDIAESFITGLKGLFEDHYIDVPAEKYDLLEGLYTKVDDLESKMNEQIEKNMEISKDLLESRCSEIFLKTAADLTDTEIEKLASLAEGIAYDDVDQYSEKLSLLKESYFDVSEDDTVVLEAEEIVHDGTLVEATEEDAPVLSESMQRYAAVLGKVATASKQV